VTVIILLFCVCVGTTSAYSTTSTSAIFNFSISQSFPIQSDAYADIALHTDIKEDNINILVFMPNIIS
jgi:hypothetical protein